MRVLLVTLGVLVRETIHKRVVRGLVRNVCLSILFINLKYGFIIIYLCLLATVSIHLLLYSALSMGLGSGLGPLPGTWLL